jgi:NTE family protein
MQDLLFATQSRRALAAWQAIFDARGDDAASVTLLRLAYSDQDEEVAGKAFDFSPPSAAKRWNSGYADMARMLSALAQGAIETCRPGLAVYQMERSEVKDVIRVHMSMRPVVG